MESRQIDRYAARIDYVTVTAKAKSVKSYGLQSYGTALMTRLAIRDKAPGVRSARHLGYSGYITEGAFIGARDDGVMFRASGELADESWREAVYYADNVSRLDLCVDVFHVKQSKGEAEKAYRLLLSNDLTKAKRISLVVSADSGSTLYLGSRSSEKMLRLYDKGIEAGIAGEGEIWRYELELKGAMATSISLFLRSIDYDLEPDAIGALFHKLLGKAANILPWPESQSGFERVVDRVKTDVDRRLAWLKRQVSPAVIELVSRGFDDEVLKALGLSGRICVAGTDADLGRRWCPCP